MPRLLDRALGFERELIEIRRDLHRHPELAFQEVRTAGIAADRVAALGFEVRRGVGRTGVVAVLRNVDGPVVALRADMDALPIQEANEVDYASTVPGVMHACGHDAHVAGLIGAARLLAEARDRGELPPGTVRLLFQPSEETSDEENRTGAERMIEDGAMAGVDAVFGLHVWASLPAGRVYLRPGPLMAGSDMVYAAVEGRASHAARPHEGVDAVVLAAHAVLACQNIVARRISPLDAGVVTIGTIQGGVAPNVVAERVELRGTIRYFEEHVRTVLHREVRAAFDSVRALGGHATVEIVPACRPVRNDPAMTELARAAVADALGEDVIEVAELTMGAEDFSAYLEHAPGAFIWLGAAPNPPREHHHPLFDIDERVLACGTTILAACAIRALAELRSRARQNP